MMHTFDIKSIVMPDPLSLFANGYAVERIRVFHAIWRGSNMKSLEGGASSSNDCIFLSCCTPCSCHAFFSVAGFRPGRRGSFGLPQDRPFVSAKGPKTMDAPSGHMGAEERQPEEGGPARGACVLSLSKGSNKARQVMRASLLWARRQASEQEETNLSVMHMKKL
jgi:hypothetical protein